MKLSKESMKAAGTMAAAWLPDVMMVAGASTVSFGASLIYQPAGFIVAGLFLLAGGWLVARGGA